jgi:3-oxoadipate enol-lactonase
MSFLSLDGCDLYYEVHGDGPALVFAHGAGGNHLSWWQQVPHFRDRYRCVVFAHRGFAPSTGAADEAGRAAFADDLAALIDHLGLADARLVAQSMGGATALGYALRAPGRVAALVLASTTGGVGPLLGDGETERLRAGLPTREEVLARGGLPGHERMQREQPALFHLYRGLTAVRDAHLATPRALPGGRVPISPEALGGLTMPVLCLAGEEDSLALPAALEALAAWLPNGRYASVPAAGHSVYFERAAAFNRIVDDFLTSVAG